MLKHGFCNTMKVYVNFKGGQAHAVNTSWAMLALICAGQVRTIFFQIFMRMSSFSKWSLSHCLVADGARSNTTASCCKRTDQYAARNRRFSPTSRFAIEL